MTEDELKEQLAKLYDPEAAREAREKADELMRNGTPFSKEAHEARVKNHPIFSKLHLISKE
jgi:hypothetical protein